MWTAEEAVMGNGMGKKKKDMLNQGFSLISME